MISGLDPQELIWFMLGEVAWYGLKSRLLVMAHYLFVQNHAHKLALSTE